MTTVKLQSDISMDLDEVGEDDVKLAITLYQEQGPQYVEISRERALVLGSILTKWGLGQADPTTLITTQEA